MSMSFVKKMCAIFRLRLFMLRTVFGYFEKYPSSQ